MNRDIARLQHIMEAIEAIEYAVTHDPDDYKTETFVLHKLQIIGEAVRHLSQELKQTHPDIRWTDIITMRNYIVHEYFDVDDAVVWDAVRKDIPLLKGKILVIISSIR